MVEADLVLENRVLVEVELVEVAQLVQMERMD
jgi:hypothetical protein